MKYSIVIPQREAIESWLPLDIIDLAILDFIKDFTNSPNTRKITLNGVIFYWISYQKILDDMPILGIKTKSWLYRRVKNLVDTRILIEHEKNMESGRTFFWFWENYEKMFFSASEPSADSQRTLCEQAEAPSAAPQRDKNINDNNTRLENISAREDLFPEFWKIYPRKEDRKNSEKKFASLSDKDKADALAGLRKYASYWNAAGTARQYIPHPSTFLNGRRWEDEIPDAVRPRSFEKPVPKNVLVGDRDYSAGTGQFASFTH